MNRNYRVVTNCRTGKRAVASEISHAMRKGCLAAAAAAVIAAFPAASALADTDFVVGGNTAPGTPIAMPAAYDKYAGSVYGTDAANLYQVNSQVNGGSSWHVPYNGSVTANITGTGSDTLVLTGKTLSLENGALIVKSDSNPSGATFNYGVGKVQIGLPASDGATGTSGQGALSIEGTYIMDSVTVEGSQFAKDGVTYRPTLAINWTDADSDADGVKGSLTVNSLTVNDGDFVNHGSLTATTVTTDIKRDTVATGLAIGGQMAGALDTAPAGSASVAALPGTGDATIKDMNVSASAKYAYGVTVQGDLAQTGSATISATGTEKAVGVELIDKKGYDGTYLGKSTAKLATASVTASAPDAIAIDVPLGAILEASGSLTAKATSNGSVDKVSRAIAIEAPEGSTVKADKMTVSAQASLSSITEADDAEAIAFALDVAKASVTVASSTRIDAGMSDSATVQHSAYVAGINADDSASIILEGQLTGSFSGFSGTVGGLTAAELQDKKIDVNASLIHLNDNSELTVKKGAILTVQNLSSDLGAAIQVDSGSSLKISQSTLLTVTNNEESAGGAYGIDVQGDDEGRSSMEVDGLDVVAVSSDKTGSVSKGIHAGRADLTVNSTASVTVAHVAHDLGDRAYGIILDDNSVAKFGSSLIVTGKTAQDESDEQKGSIGISVDGDSSLAVAGNLTLNAEKAIVGKGQVTAGGNVEMAASSVRDFEGDFILSNTGANNISMALTSKAKSLNADGDSDTKSADNGWFEKANSVLVQGKDGLDPSATKLDISGVYDIKPSKLSNLTVKNATLVATSGQIFEHALGGYVWDNTDADVSKHSVAWQYYGNTDAGSVLWTNASSSTGVLQIADKEFNTEYIASAGRAMVTAGSDMSLVFTGVLAGSTPITPEPDDPEDDPFDPSKVTEVTKANIAKIYTDGSDITLAKVPMNMAGEGSITIGGTTTSSVVNANVGVSVAKMDQGSTLTLTNGKTLTLMGAIPASANEAPAELMTGATSIAVKNKATLALGKDTVSNVDGYSGRLSTADVSLKNGTLATYGAYEIAGTVTASQGSSINLADGTDVTGKIVLEDSSTMAVAGQSTIASIKASAGNAIAIEGADEAPSEVKFKEAELGGATVYVGNEAPASTKKMPVAGIETASMLSIATPDGTMDGNIIAGRNAIVAIGEAPADRAEAEKVFADMAEASGASMAWDANTTGTATNQYSAMACVNSPVDLGSNGRLAVGSSYSASTGITKGSVSIASGGILALNMANANGKPMLSGEGSLTFADGSALYAKGAHGVSQVFDFEDGVSGYDKVLITVSALRKGKLDADGNLTVSVKDARGVKGLQAVNATNAVLRAYEEDPGIANDGAATINQILDEGVTESDAWLANRIDKLSVVGAAAAMQQTGAAVRHNTADIIDRHLTRAIDAHRPGGDLWADASVMQSKSSGYKFGSYSYGHKFTGEAVSIGFDNTFQRTSTVFGVAATAAMGTSKGSGFGSGVKNKVSGYGVQLYGSKYFFGGNLIGKAGFMKLANKITASGMDGSDKPSTVMLNIGARYERDFLIAGLYRLTPHVGIDLVKSKAGSFELGGFKYSQGSAMTYEVPIGVTAKTTLPRFHGWRTRVSADLSVIPAFGDKNVKTKFSVSGLDGKDSITTGIGGSVSARLQLGIEAIKKRHSFGASLGYGTGSHSRKDAALKLRYRYTF